MMNILITNRLYIIYNYFYAQICLNIGILGITFIKSAELYLMTAIDHYLQPCEVVSLQNCKFDSKIGRENDNNRHYSDFQICFILKLE